MHSISGRVYLVMVQRHANVFYDALMENKSRDMRAIKQPHTIVMVKHADSDAPADT